MEHLYSENNRGLIETFWKSLDIQEDEFQLELTKPLHDKFLLNFSESSSFIIYK